MGYVHFCSCLIEDMKYDQSPEPFWWRLQSPNDLNVDMGICNGMRNHAISYQKEEDMVMMFAVLFIFIVHAERCIHMTQVMIFI